MVTQSTTTNGGGAKASATRPVVLYPSPGMGHLVSMIELGKTLGARGLPDTILVIDPPYNTGATAPFLAAVSAANPSITFHRFPKVDALPPWPPGTRRRSPSRWSAPPTRTSARSSPRPTPAPPSSSSTSSAAPRSPPPRTTACPPTSSSPPAPRPWLSSCTCPCCTRLPTRASGTWGTAPCGCRASRRSRPRTQSCPSWTATTTPTTASSPCPPASAAPRASSSTRSARWSTAPSTPSSRDGARRASTASGRSSSRRMSRPREAPSAWRGWTRSRKAAWCSSASAASAGSARSRYGSSRPGWRPAGSGSCGWSGPRPATTRPSGSTGRRSRIWTRSSRGASWPGPRAGASLSSRGRRSGTCWLTRPWVGSSHTAAGTPFWRRSWWAWPLYAEQRMNRVFLEEELQLAVAVEGYDSDTGIVPADEVAAKVRWLMESEGGRVLRERTLAAMRQAKDALGKGGESEATLAGLVDAWRTASTE